MKFKFNLERDVYKVLANYKKGNYILRKATVSYGKNGEYDITIEDMYQIITSEERDELCKILKAEVVEKSKYKTIYNEYSIHKLDEEFESEEEVIKFFDMGGDLEDFLVDGFSKYDLEYEEM